MSYLLVAPGGASKKETCIFVYNYLGFTNLVSQLIACTSHSTPNQKKKGSWFDNVEG
jgi:hypothetical protein